MGEIIPEAAAQPLSQEMQKFKSEEEQALEAQAAAEQAAKTEAAKNQLYLRR